MTTEPASVLVLFDDQSSMKIKTTGAAAVSRSKVKSVHEAKAEFRIEFEDGSSATFCLADPGSSVAVRDKTMQSNTSDNLAPLFYNSGRFRTDHW